MRAHDAWLLIDDAHGFGVLGPQGRARRPHSASASPRLLVMATLGKAAGAAGAFVAGETEAVEWLMQRARSYIFATAAPAMVVAAACAGLALMAADDTRRQHLARLVARLRAGAHGLRWPLLASDTAIQPLIVGDNATTLAAQAALQARGLWVPAIRPPTVPEGSARLRISLSAAHSEADVDRLVQALAELAATSPGARANTQPEPAAA